MAVNTKDLRTRIKSITSTLQLTKAMGLVASSKIRKANENMYKAREYRNALDQAIMRLASSDECEKSPYMRKSENVRSRIIVIAGDRGLAGGYNSSVLKLASTFEDAEIIPIGKRACEKFGADKIISSERFYFNDAAILADGLCEDFLNGEFDKLGIIYTNYISVISSEPTIKWLLPFEASDKKSNNTMIYEPDAQTVLENIVKEYVAGTLIACVRESFASEVAARRMAMDSAGKNAKEMIDDLQLAYNRARQGAITQEITEIVAGSGE